MSIKLGTPSEILLPVPKEDQRTAGFLEGYKVLKPIDDEIIPPAINILKHSPIQKLVVGITGVSCGGKTTMANSLKQWLGAIGTSICQDDYYKPAETLPINEITNFYEFDEPESVRMERIVEDIKAWKNDQSDTEGPNVLVVEGTMIFTSPEIFELCDLRYMIHVDFETAEYRRSLRNYPIPDPPRVVELNIWPKYLKHRRLARNIAAQNGYIFKQINGTDMVEHILAGLIADLAKSEHL